MQNLVTLQTTLTMSSREIAELTGKRHADVLRDIRNTFDQLGNADLRSEQYQVVKLPNGMTGEILLDHDLSVLLITGYDVKARMAVIKRWKELEAQQAPKLPTSYIEALQALIESEKAKQQAEQLAAIAIATKAEIGSRREATAMNTASQAVKKANELEVQLDQSKQYCTIKRMEMLNHGQKFDWRLMKSTSIALGIAPIDVFDSNFGTVKSYHKDAWFEAYAQTF
jgi:phage regulator Rha-like protein